MILKGKENENFFSHMDLPKLCINKREKRITQRNS